MRPLPRLSVLLASLLLCLICGVLYAWSIFVIPLEQAFAWERAETSLTFTLMISFFSLGMFAGGKMLQYGPAKAVQCGGLFLGAGLLWAARIDTVWELYASYGVLAGFGLGIVNIVPAAVCLRWYPEHKGVISGLLTMTLAFGTLSFGTLGAGWLIGLVGVSATFSILAYVFMGLILLCSLFVRMPETTQHTVFTEGGVPLRAMLRLSSYWMIWIWMFSIQIGGLMIIGHVVPYAMECGFSSSQAAFGMGAYAVANGCGRLLFGYIHDRYGFVVGLCADALLMGVGLMLLTQLSAGFGSAGFFVAVVCVALAFGGTIPQLAAMIMTFFGPRYFGVNYGFSTSPLMVASLFGPYFGGVLRMWSGSYLLPLYIAALVTVLGVIPAFILQKQIARNTLHPTDCSFQRLSSSKEI